MSQTPHHLSDDTSDKLYTPEELASYAAAESASEWSRPAPPTGPPTGGGYRPDPLTDPLHDGHEPTVIRPRPVLSEVPPPPPSSPARQVTTAGPGSGSPSGPPAGPLSGPPSGPRSGPPTGPPSGPPPGPPSGPPPAPPVRSAAGSPPGPPPAAPSAAPSTTPATTPPEAAEPRRFMTATDFLDRRAEEQEAGPATWGWRGRVRRWSGGTINPRMGAAERAYVQDRALIQKDFDGPKTIAFINPKGGAAKTTGVLAAGYTFGTIRGGGVVAWDNNETRGTLGIRGARSSHIQTTKELLADLGKFSDVTQSRIGDLGAYVRSQGDAHFDVLASDESPNVTGQIHADDFNSIHQLLMRFYKVILVDTGNNMRAENWLAAADAADLLVVTSTVREDTGYSGLWMLDALQDAGYQNLKYKTVTVLSDPSTTVDTKLAADLVDVYQQRTRGVYRVPYDAALVAGSVLPYNQLSPGTRMSWLRACAGMASAL
jgi:MinD-like ATPase involved in chromosome partitioning or flagellar assembly